MSDQITFTNYGPGKRSLGATFACDKVNRLNKKVRNFNGSVTRRFFLFLDRYAANGEG